MSIRSLVSALLLVYLSCTSAFGCEGKQVLFEDQFQDELSGWTSSPNIKFQNSAMYIVAKPGWPETTINFAFAFKSADVCVDAKIDKVEAANAMPGLVFWAEDNDNFWLLQITADRGYAIQRLKDNKWLSIASGDVPNLNPSKFTKARVVVNGNVVEFYINGQRVKQLRAQAPTSSWMVGLYMQGGSAEFKNFKVTSVQ